MTESSDARIRRLRAQIGAMVQEARPDRYTVDESGRASWMDEVADRIAEDPTITVADLLLVRRAGIIDEVFSAAGIDGGEVPG